VRSTIDLAHNLGLRVVAEGVENQESWRRLREQGCDLAQGYHVSRPLPGDELGRLIAAHEASHRETPQLFEMPEPPRSLRVVGGVAQA
jgi:EAL domain-containing protein (putative c-di-GMP-specific phosphodiesterase class I)